MMMLFILLNIRFISVEILYFINDLILTNVFNFPETDS
jgi:hypothetical protein